jgi:hypothetical protein
MISQFTFVTELVMLPLIGVTLSTITAHFSDNTQLRVFARSEPVARCVTTWLDFLTVENALNKTGCENDPQQTCFYSPHLGDSEICFEDPKIQDSAIRILIAKDMAKRLKHGESLSLAGRSAVASLQPLIDQVEIQTPNRDE